MEILDFMHWKEGGEARQAFLKALLLACEQDGFFYLKNHGIPPERCAGILAAAAASFDLPAKDKEMIHINHSSNFRGYSILKNERDWREQFHFGWEWPEFQPRPNLPDYYQLAGTNLFPTPLGESFKSEVMAYMKAVNELGQELLLAIATSLGLTWESFSPPSQEPAYLLLKFICYYPQPDGGQRPGVAPHCDWSWLTILLQDNLGGLEILSEEGKWLPARPLDGCLSVNLGELLEIVTHGRLKATPHRVINPSQAKKRLSVPAFINPPLNTMVSPIPGWGDGEKKQPFPEHVHRVVERAEDSPAFVFGESEWNRKGLGRWCYSPSCLSK